MCHINYATANCQSESLPSPPSSRIWENKAVMRTKKRSRARSHLKVRITVRKRHLCIVKILQIIVRFVFTFPIPRSGMNLVLHNSAPSVSLTGHLNTSTFNRFVCNDLKFHPSSRSSFSGAIVVCKVNICSFPLHIAHPRAHLFLTLSTGRSMKLYGLRSHQG